MEANRIEDYLNFVKRVEDSFKKNQELFDYEKMIEFKQITSALENNLKIAQDASRKLSIGIVGAVKAGKSSFLNACIFDGEEYLPKAATPMTAALTKITYSDNPKAIIHFYTNEDWEIIKHQASLYDSDLNAKYEEYYRKEQLRYSQGTLYNDLRTCMTLEQFEKGYKCKSESQKGAKELIRMVKNQSILSKLDQSEVIQGDIIAKLNDYVSVNGLYTPIVSYVELHVNNPLIKDLEIVDTPGLNDPIVSRGIRTKQFLRSCDVVLLLSRCSQFMDAQTVSMMASSLPDAGVREVLIVGSKLDSGILNENSNNFGVAYINARNSYITQFNNNLLEVKRKGKNLDILNKMSLEKVLFASSTCYFIHKKLKSKIPLNSEEKKVHDNLHQRFIDFKDNSYLSLSGMNNIKKKLNEILKCKTQIIESKNTELLDIAKNNHIRIIEKILEETVSSRTKLATTSAEELKSRTSLIKDVIDSSRSKLFYIFDYAIQKCDEKVQDLLPEIKKEASKHQNIKVDNKSRELTETQDVGFLGLKKEIVYYTVHESFADISSVINNVKNYAAKVHDYVNKEFKYIFNKEEFSQKIKEVILNAFSKSQRDFDEDDILLPLQNVLAKISIPHIELDCTPYIDELQTRFRKGSVKNEEIYQLNIIQTKLLNDIELEMGNQLDKALKNIIKVLQAQANTFADHIERDFCGELEKLESQVTEKEKYIKEYKKFTEDLRKIKSDVMSI